MNIHEFFKKPAQYTKKSYFERNFVKIKSWKTVGEKLQEIQKKN